MSETRPATTIDRKGPSGTALRTFFRCAELWRLPVEERMTLLGVAVRSTFFKWKRDLTAILRKGALERGVHKALQILLPDEKAADEWMKRPNAALLCGSRPALERMLSGQVADLFIVRQHRDAQRGWA